MLKLKYLWILCLFSFAPRSFAEPTRGNTFDRMILVMFENTNFEDVMKQSFFSQLAVNGALFSNFMAITHPSQPNYIAMTSGSLNGVRDNNNVNLDVRHIADLLEEKGLRWKAYVEDYPGNCFTGSTNRNYARKHNPFISYVNIQNNPSRCANIVNSAQFEVDAASGNLPNFIFYVPDNRNSGHDTGVSFANSWYEKRFSKYFLDSKFMENTVVVSTFDESGISMKNRIYTSLFGPNIKTGIYSESLNHYSLLNLLEKNWTLGDLGKLDVTAPVFPEIFQKKAD